MAIRYSLDLVLVNPGSRTQIYQSLGHSLAAIEPPVWAGLIATFVRRKGFSVALLDANAENLTPQQTAQRILEMKPLLTAVVVYGHNPSASTQVMPAAGEICSALKQLAPELKVLLVGGHVAALPERTLQEEAADFVCTGEGPHTIVELLEALQATSKPAYSNVRGLGYRFEGRPVLTSAASLVRDLDADMPEMAWDLLDMKRYRAHNWHCFGGLSREPYASIYTTLGCPYRCTFCCIHAPFEDARRPSIVNSYRYWSPQSVIAQLDKLVIEYGVQNVKFADELFVLNPKHVLGICDLIVERGYKLNIWAYARVDSIRENMLEKLKRAGVNWLALGIEAANEYVREDVHKGFDQAYLFEIVEKVRQAGIYVGANYIFGLPEDDLATMQATLNLAVNLNAEYANFYATMAYPGSQLYQTALRAGWPLPEKWSGYSQHSIDSRPLPTKYISGEEVLRFRDQAFQVYFGSPKYLDMVTQKFGAETVRQIREMTLVRLKRNAPLRFAIDGGGEPDTST